MPFDNTPINKPETPDYIAQAIELLQQSRDRMAQPYAWCKGAYARTDHYAPEGLARCAQGTITSIATDEGARVYSRHLSVALAVLNSCTPGHRSVVGFNDDPQTTLPMVLALFDRAIEVLKFRPDAYIANLLMSRQPPSIWYTPPKALPNG